MCRVECFHPNAEYADESKGAGVLSKCFSGFATTERNPNLSSARSTGSSGSCQIRVSSIKGKNQVGNEALKRKKGRMERGLRCPRDLKQKGRKRKGEGRSKHQDRQENTTRIGKRPRGTMTTGRDRETSAREVWRFPLPGKPVINPEVGKLS